MRPAGKVFDRALNIAALVVVVVVGFVGMRHMGSPAEPERAVVRSLRIGDAVTAFPGMNWDGRRPNLVMAMQVGCHWCELSAPFYRYLLRRNAPETFHPIAVFPQPVVQSQAFLHKLELSISDVREADFNKLGVTGTPTLILVDGQGRITATWNGYLSPIRQKGLLAALGIPLDVSNTEQSNAAFH